MTSPDNADTLSDEQTWRSRTRYTARVSAIFAVLGALAVGLIQVLLGILSSGFSGWWHSLTSVWLLSSLAAVLLLILGFGLGMLYAVSIGVYLAMLAYAKLLRQPSPRRNRWWAPLDWTAVGVTWSAAGAFSAAIWVAESLSALRQRFVGHPDAQQQENEKLRAENERLRAENERLKNQAGNIQP